MIPDRKQFLEIVNSADCLTLAIRGHQAIESALNAAISEALPEPHVLEVADLSFALKIDLAIALRVIRADSQPIFVRLNRIRNQFAHKATAAFEKKEAEDTFNAFSPWQRSILGSDTGSADDPLDTLRRAIAIAFIEAKSSLKQLQERKLEDEVLHEILQETLAGSPVLKDDYPGTQQVRNEVLERLEAKKRERGLNDDAV